MEEGELQEGRSIPNLASDHGSGIGDHSVLLGSDSKPTGLERSPMDDVLPVGRHQWWNRFDSMGSGNLDRLGRERKGERQ